MPGIFQNRAVTEWEMNSPRQQKKLHWNSRNTLGRAKK